LGWALEAGGAMLAKQTEPLKEMLVLTDAELVIPGDPEKTARWLKNVPRSVSVTGILLIDPDDMSGMEETYIGYMKKTFAGHRLAICTAEMFPDVLNGILTH
jgi:hypothetical protein